MKAKRLILCVGWFALIAAGFVPGASATDGDDPLACSRWVADPDYVPRVWHELAQWRDFTVDSSVWSARLAGTATESLDADVNASRLMEAIADGLASQPKPPNRTLSETFLATAEALEYGGENSPSAMQCADNALGGSAAADTVTTEFGRAFQSTPAGRAVSEVGRTVNPATCYVLQFIPPLSGGCPP